MLAFTLAGCVAIASASCRPAVSLRRASWLIVAPHPDDEVLIAGGLLAGAVARGEDVAVVVVTNGDFDCVNDGEERERESIAGLASVGVPESRVYFLGFPDGALARLGRTPLTVRRRAADGRCTPGNTTYGAHGQGRADYHRARWGAPAPYTRDALVGDLASIISAVRPTDLVTTHPADTHQDHAATYALVRGALDRLIDAPRKVHRAIVHNGDCWPVGTAPREPCPVVSIAPDQPTPPLTGRLSRYGARERLAVPPSCRRRNAPSNPKVRAIAAHQTQTHGSFESYLFAFARSDEPFFPETLERRPGAASWTRVGTAAADALSVTTQHRFLQGDERWAFTASVPVILSARLEQSSTHVRLLADATGAYAFDVDAGTRQARLARESHDAAGDRVVELQQWPLPYDLWSTSETETFELRIDPRPDDAGVAELSLYVRGALVGVAVDVHPRRSGEWLGVSCPYATDVRVSGFPSARRVP